MIRAALCTVLMAASVLFAQAEYSCTGQPNTIPMYTDAPTLVNQTTNGLKFTVGPEDLDPKLTVVHLYGSPYEWGFAYGTLLGEEMRTLFPQAFEFAGEAIKVYMSYFPKAWQPQIEKYGVQRALNLTFTATSPYIAQEYMDELQGIADASGIPAWKVRNLALFPELIKAACSMFGAWGDATKYSRDGALVQLRALDWSTNGPFQQFPVVLVYHPEEGNGHAFATVSWAGLVGSITGYSSAEVGVCEKVWAAYKGAYAVDGIPFTFLLRDILQYDTSIQAAEARIANAHRTCSIYIGLGDAKVPNFNLVDYSHPAVTFYNDTDFPAYPPDHDLFNGLLFYDKHEQPSHDPCLNDLLKQYYGHLDTTVTYQNITAVFQTGDMHIAIYDFAEHTMAVANAGVFNATTGAVPAYDRPFVQLDMAAAFAMPKP